MGETHTVRTVALVLVAGLLAAACGSGAAPEVATADSVSPDPVAETAEAEPEPTATTEPAPTATTTAETDSTPAPEPTATPTTEPEPTDAPEPVVLAAAEPTGPFVCANQEPGEVIVDDELSDDLLELLGPGIPGLVAATASSDGLLRIGAAGQRSAGADADDDAMLATDRMHLGSDTKAMTGALLALLGAEGGIGLTTLVTDVWPDADSGWDGVTLLDLLHHRGGAEDSLGRDLGDVWAQLWESSVAAHGGTLTERAAAAQADRADFAATLTSAEPSEQVGQFAYSNSGYMLVGAAIEDRLGAPWEQLMCEHLFEPLRMDGCGFGVPPAPAPQGHSDQAGDLLPSGHDEPGADNPFALGPAGTVYCPVTDWSRFLSWVLRGAQGDDDRLSAETWEALLSPDGDYAAGWGVASRAWSPGPIYTHAGSNTMWFAVTWVAPGIDRAFMAVSNAATPEAQAATDQAIGLLLAADAAP